MAKEYQYIKFVEVEQKPKTKVWACHSRATGTILGMVKWHPGWRQYCLFPVGNTIWSGGCLADVMHFLEQARLRRV